MRVLVHGRLAAPRADSLRARAAPGWDIDVWDPATASPEAFAEKVATADVIVGGAVPLSPWPAAPHLKLWQIPWTGHEFARPEEVPAGLPVANTFEHETAIAEYVLAAMLEWQIGLRRMDARFRAEGWGGMILANGPRHGEVLGKTVGIVGHGHIGREVAHRARAFGMRAIGIRRASAPCPPELDWLGGPGDLHRLLGEADFVVIACDLNAATRGMIDAAALSAMKPTGVLINVARGAIVEEDALFAALSERRIGGAVIDVWYRYAEPGQPEPWPAHHPFETLDNVLLSAHESGTTAETFARRWDFVAANIARIARGAPPENVIFEGQGPPP